jgi:hypothetical protein
MLRLVVKDPASVGVSAIESSPLGNILKIGSFGGFERIQPLIDNSTVHGTAHFCKVNKNWITTDFVGLTIKFSRVTICLHKLLNSHIFCNRRKWTWSIAYLEMVFPMDTLSIRLSH